MALMPGSRGGDRRGQAGVAGTGGVAGPASPSGATMGHQCGLSLAASGRLVALFLGAVAGVGEHLAQGGGHGDVDVLAAGRVEHRGVRA